MWMLIPYIDIKEIIAMPSSNIAKAREFRQRYQLLSQNAGYNLVYDTIALLMEYIPCKNISLFSARPKTLDTNKVLFKAMPMMIGTKYMVDTLESFLFMYERIPFATQFGSYILSQAMADQPIQAYSFSDHIQHRKGLVHYFYKQLNISDILVIAGLVARNQFVHSPQTDSYYGLVLNFAHSEGQAFSQDEKELLALCFDIFLDDFKTKIRSPENNLFLPQITGELICEKTKLEALFSTGKKFSPRQLATIKACFDLKQQQRKITCREVARYLHLQDQDSDEATLKNAGAKVDHDLGKIKDQLLRDFPTDCADYARFKKALRIEHLPDVFQTYAYFGLYPDTAGRYSSYLEYRLGKWG